jgi:DNA-binding NarL/FixJ family response regulator
MIKLRIFVACSDERLRIAMLMLLDQEPGMGVVGITDRLPGLLLHLEASQPDVLLLAWDLTLQALADLLTDIHNLASPPKVIFFSNKPEEEEQIIATGTDHFISENAPPDKLLLILRELLVSDLAAGRAA